jgi:hypothetical protein
MLPLRAQRSCPEGEGMTLHNVAEAFLFRANAGQPRIERGIKHPRRLWPHSGSSAGLPRTSWATHLTEQDEMSLGYKERGGS